MKTEIKCNFQWGSRKGNKSRQGKNGRKVNIRQVNGASDWVRKTKDSSFVRTCHPRLLHLKLGFCS